MTYHKKSYTYFPILFRTFPIFMKREKPIGDVRLVSNIITQCDVRRFVLKAQPCAKGIRWLGLARGGCVASRTKRNARSRFEFDVTILFELRIRYESLRLKNKVCVYNYLNWSVCETNLVQCLWKFGTKREFAIGLV